MRLGKNMRYTFCATCQSDVGVTTNAFGGGSGDRDVVWVTQRHKNTRGQWCGGGRVSVPSAVIFVADGTIKAGTALA